MGVRGRTTDRVNKGRLGPKGLNGSVYPLIRYSLQFFMLILYYRWITLGHPDRLKWPLIRRDGQLQRATWDEAMSLIAQKAKDVCARLTNHGIGFYTSGQLFLEEYYVLAMVGKAGLNTLHMYEFFVIEMPDDLQIIGMATLGSALQLLRPACGNLLGVMDSLDLMQISIIPIACFLLVIMSLILRLSYGPVCWTG